jgi:glycosyltransferase involved in cell wall biosynthesis
VHGVPKVSEVFLSYLRKCENVDVDIYCISDDVADVTSVDTSFGRVVYIPGTRSIVTGNLALLGVFRCAAKLISGRYDVIHAQPPVENFIAAAISHTATLYTLHGIILREYAGVSKREWWRWAAGLLREACFLISVRYASRGVAIADYIQSYIATRSSARFHRIPNPIEPVYSQIKPPTWNALRIICVGTVSRRKNQFTLLQACKILREAGIEFSCKIVGQPLDAWDICKTFVRENRMEDVVNLTGAVSAEDVVAAYEWSNVVVLPSLAESAPLSLAQGMLCGRLCIGANSGGTPEILGYGEYGLIFEPNNPQMLAELLQQTGREMTRGSEHALVGKAHAEQVYSCASVIAQTVELYRGIVAERGSWSNIV